MSVNVTWRTQHEISDGGTITVPYRKTEPDKFLYMYLDESGNLDFKSSGTPYFIMTCATASRPFITAEKMRDLRYDLMEKGIDIEKFHACEDSNDTRKLVYGILSALEDAYRVYTVYVKKNEVPENLRTPDSVYSAIFSLLVDEIYKSEKIINLEGVVIITDRLPKDAVKKQVVKPLKKYMKEKFLPRHIPYILMHHDSASDMNLQAADYFCWAEHRKLTQGKDWPMKVVEPFFVKLGKVDFNE